MGKKCLNDCRSSNDLVKVAKAGGLEVRRGKGSHIVVRKPGFGSAAIPDHGNEELGKGLLHTLLKWFVAAGLGVFVLMGYALYLGMWTFF